MRYILLYIWLILPMLSWSQQRSSDKPFYTVGLQYRPIVPVDVFDGGAITQEEEYLRTTIEPKLGHSFGVLIRRSFTERWSVETGIAQIRRNYNVYAEDLDSGFIDTSDFGAIQYQIPLQGLYYVQLGRDVFMNVLAGISIDFYPTDIATKGDRNDFTHRGFRREWVQTSLLANVGWEYRTRENGYFYFGISLHRPFKSYMFSAVNYNRGGITNDGPTTVTELNGNFMSLDFRYFLPVKEEKDD